MVYANHERRWERRFPFVEDVSFSDGIGFYQGKVRDISSTGMQIEAMRNLRPGAALILTLPTSPPLKLEGRVRWVKRSGLRCRVGLRFQDLQPAQQVRLAELINSLCWQSSR